LQSEFRYIEHHQVSLKKKKWKSDLVRNLEAVPAGFPHQISARQRPCIPKQTEIHTVTAAKLAAANRASREGSEREMFSLRGSAMPASRMAGSGAGTLV
jgi:hypothetical protein